MFAILLAINTILMKIGTKQGLFQFIDICTKYGFCEEVVYKLM